MADDAYVELVTAADGYLTERQDRLRKEFHLNDHERWDWDQYKGQIVFSTKQMPQLIADIRFVGSVSNKTGTWLWSWANESLEEQLTRDVVEVRKYGEAHDIWQLHTPKWEADEVDGWEMTSISAYILRAEGAYRTPGDTGLSFMLLDRVRWASEGVRPIG